MSFLKRLFGGGGEEPGAEAAVAPTDPAQIEEEERKHEREVLRAEAERLDELRQRQLRYSQYAWTPPPQGGERRADDEEADGGRADG